ncbi:MAG: pilus assembly protein PilM [Lachnospiraceae bacterium]|nr:pilus assembly protein PilM [Lachnospiraceae bacterium]
MAGKVLSIEIGYLFTRVCEVDYKSKAPKVYKRFTVPTLQGVMNDGVIDADSHYVEGLRSGLREFGIKSKSVVFTLASTKIATREVVVPFVKENRIGSMVKANASEYFPVDLSQYEIAYSVMDILGNKAEGQQYKLMVLAIPTNILEGYYKLAASLRLEVEAFDYAGTSLYRVMKSECAVGTHMVAKIDERSTLIMVIKDEQIAFTRNISYGVEDALQAVMESVAWGNIRTMRQALQTIETYQCIDLNVREEGARPISASLEETAQINVTEALAPLIAGMSRVIDYYSAQNGSSPIDNVLITGVGSNFLGIDELLSREIDHPITIVRKVSGMNLEKYFKETFFGEYLTCIGASIAPLGLMKDEDKKKKTQVELLPDKNSVMVISIVVCVGGILIGAAMAAISIFGYNEALTEQKQMQTRIAQLEPVENIYKEYLQQQYTYNKLTYFQNSTVTPNEELVAFIEEMEQKMPASLHVQSFNADLEGVTMSLTVENKDDAAWLIQQFRGFETIETVGVSSITDSGALMDGQVIQEEPVVSLTVVLTYKASEAQAAIDAANEAAAQAAAEAAAATQTE